MKKLAIAFGVALAAALAFSCDADNRSGDRGLDNDTEQTAPLNPDERDIHSDTTTSGGMNRQNQYDTL